MINDISRGIFEQSKKGDSFSFKSVIENIDVPRIKLKKMENMNSLKMSPRNFSEKNEPTESTYANNNWSNNEYIFQLQKESLELKKLNESLFEKVKSLENELITKNNQIKELKEFESSFKQIKEENVHNLSYIKTLQNENELLQKECVSIKADYDDLFIKFENLNRLKKTMQATQLNKKSPSSQSLFQNAANSPRAMDINLKDFPNSPKNLNNFDQISWLSKQNLIYNYYFKINQIKIICN